MAQQLVLVAIGDADAAEIGRLYALARTSLVGSVQYLVECGHRLSAKKKSLKHGEWLPWHAANEEALGFDLRNAQKLILLATKYGVNAVFGYTQALGISRQLWGNSVKPFREDDEWYTPQRYIEAVRKVFGKIDLDPASNESAQSSVKAATWYSSADDGLSHKWTGKVWLNPPYSKELLAKFVAKLVDEYQAAHVKAAILLVNNFTDSDWFQLACGACTAVCFPRDRIYFENASGKIDRPLNGQVFFYFGAEVKTFQSVFASIGAGFAGAGSWSWDGTK